MTHRCRLHRRVSFITPQISVKIWNLRRIPEEDDWWKKSRTYLVTLSFQCRIFHSKSTKISLLSILFESPISREKIHFKKCFAAVLDLIIYEACKRKLVWSVFHPPPKTRIRKSRRLFHPCFQLAHSGSKLTAIANSKPNFGLDGQAFPQIVMKQDNFCSMAEVTPPCFCCHALAGPFLECVCSRGESRAVTWPALTACDTFTGWGPQISPSLWSHDSAMREFI